MSTAVRRGPRVLSFCLLMLKGSTPSKQPQDRLAVLLPKVATDQPHQHGASPIPHHPPRPGQKCALPTVFSPSPAGGRSVNYLYAKSTDHRRNEQAPHRSAPPSRPFDCPKDQQACNP